MKQDEIDIILREHLRWLKDSYKGTKANLSHQDLRGLNLSHENLSYATLRGANLQDVNLGNANLKYTSLTRANLKGANLEHANLRGAYIEGADLTGANLYRAYLGEADFISAKIDYFLQPGLLQRIAKLVLASPRRLNMGAWDSDCGTAHCLAGWAVELNQTARELKKTHGHEIAGLLTLGSRAHSMFFKTDNEILNFLRMVK